MDFNVGRGPMDDMADKSFHRPAYNSWAIKVDKGKRGYFGFKINSFFGKFFSLSMN